MDDLKRIKQLTISRLQNIQQRIEHFHVDSHWVSRDFSMADNHEVIVNELVEKIMAGKFLYVFEADDPASIYKAYVEFGETNHRPNRLNICQLNKYDPGKTRCLYVGSGQNCRARLRQHFGITVKSNGTYALHLKKVLRDNCFEVTFRVCVLPLGDVAQDVLQELENSLWSSLTPCFGKFGGK